MIGVACGLALAYTCEVMVGCAGLMTAQVSELLPLRCQQSHNKVWKISACVLREKLCRNLVLACSAYYVLGGTSEGMCWRVLRASVTYALTVRAWSGGGLLNSGRADRDQHCSARNRVAVHVLAGSASK